jgi:hypothetical protein
MSFVVHPEQEDFLTKFARGYSEITKETLVCRAIAAAVAIFGGLNQDKFALDPRRGVKLAMRRDDRWVSIEPGITRFGSALLLIPSYV